MTVWLDKLFRRGAVRDTGADLDVSPTSVAVADRPAAQPSVWDKLKGDPSAAALREQWESRWDEF